MRVKVEDLTFELFQEKDEINKYYETNLDLINKSNILIYETDKEFAKDMYKELKRVSKEITKARYIILRDIKKMELMNKIEHFINFGANFEGKNALEEYINIGYKYEPYINILNIILAGTMYSMVIKNTRNKEIDLCKLYATYKTICMTYFNISYSIEEENKKVEYLQKGFNYSRPLHIYLDMQINFIIEKLQELEIIEELKDFIEKTIGKDNPILKLIP